jgi:hypothetical protein
MTAAEVEPEEARTGKKHDIHYLRLVINHKESLFGRASIYFGGI